MPFLRLTRDRRGFENTFLMHADHPGERPRMLYWYRTAPGIVLGRAPLDEDAIRSIEEQHPDIDFDWPAILALSEVMTPEDEAPPARERRGKGPRSRDGARDRQPAVRAGASEPPADVTPVDEMLAASPEPAADDLIATASDDGLPEAPLLHPFPEDAEPDAPVHAVPHQTTYGLLEELVGREIATRLRARYSEIGARIHEQYADAPLRDAWLKRAEPLNPDLWLTADAVLGGVRGGDALFEQLRAELLHHSSRA